jgi:hypothetical protein
MIPLAAMWPVKGRPSPSTAPNVLGSDFATTTRAETPFNGHCRKQLDGGTHSSASVKIPAPTNGGSTGCFGKGVLHTRRLASSFEPICRQHGVTAGLFVLRCRSHFTASIQINTIMAMVYHQAG